MAKTMAAQPQASSNAQTSYPKMSLQSCSWAEIRSPDSDCCFEFFATLKARRGRFNGGLEAAICSHEDYFFSFCGFLN